MVKEYNKLVRDEIIDIIRNNGEIPLYEILNDEAYKKALLNKIGEEYQEVIKATDDNEQLKELADMLSVIFALSSLLGYSKEELLNIMAEKDEKRGGFTNRIFLKSVDEK